MSKIEWTDATWNPIVGCSKVSPGCANCYAERMARRLAGMGHEKYYDTIGFYTKGWTGRPFFDESALEKPFHWRNPRMVFVCSMGDLFHESVPFEWTVKVFAAMALCPQHTFQVLTKRSERMAKFFEWLYDWNAKPIPESDFFDGERNPNGGQKLCEGMEEVIAQLSLYRGNYTKLGTDKFFRKNIWLGVTAENQEMWDKRKDSFLSIPAALRFVSNEPCLSEIRYTEDELQQLGWVICGGESGPGARPMHLDWARGLRDQCKEASVPFFFKQWGEWGICSPQDRKCKCIRTDGTIGETIVPYSCPMSRVGKKKAGCLLDGVEHKEMPGGGGL